MSTAVAQNWRIPEKVWEGDFDPQKRENMKPPMNADKRRSEVKKGVELSSRILS